MSDNSNVKVDITASAAGMTPAVSQAEQNFALLEKSANKVDAQFKQTNQALSATTISAGQLRMATQQLPLQFQDIWVSLAAGQSPMMVAMQQGSQIAGSFGGVAAGARAMASYIAGLINPITATAAALGAAGYAWYEWEQRAMRAVNSANDVLESAKKRADQTRRETDQEQILSAESRIKKIQDENYWLEKLTPSMQRVLEIEKASFFSGSAKERSIREANLKTIEANNQTIENERRLVAQLKEQLSAKESAAASKRNMASVLSIENEQFRKQMELLGVSTEQVKVYELAMNGATKAEVDRAQAAANAISIANEQIDAEKKHAKAIEETNRILANIDPLFKANQEWEKLLNLKEQNLLTDEQMGKAYAKSMKEIDKSGSDAFKSLENAVRGWGSQFTEVMTQSVMTAKADFSGLRDSIIHDLISIQIQKRMTAPLVNAGTSFLDGLFKGSFEGGGYTGSGSRTGGVDGRGGFPAILHPDETVIDHTLNASAATSQPAGASVAPSVVVQLINQSGQNVSARQQGGPQFDGRDWVIGVVLEAMDSNPNFRNALAGAGA